MAEQMKPSGIDWIKDIPSSWEINKVKYLATEPGTLFLDGDWIESDVIEESGIRYLTTGNVGAGFYKEQGSGYISEKTFSELHCLNVYPGDLMISRLNEPIGRSCIIPDTESRYVVAVDNVILRPNANYNKKFIMYGMNADGYAEHANMIARGATMSRISRSQLGQFWLAFPNIEEQQAIADFLDKECAQIDSIAADLEKQVALLQQYKKSLITETVTKGLNKSVPMKDSGVACIGLVPMSWGYKKLGYMADVTKLAGFEFTNYFEYVDDGVIAIRGLNLKNFDVSLADIQYIPEKTSNMLPRSQVHYNDVLVSYAGTVGSVGLITDTAKRYHLAPNVGKVTVFSELIPRYLAYYLISYTGQELIDQLKNKNAQESISMENIRRIKILVPPQIEQQNICDYLDKKTGEIDTLIDAQQKKLELMQAHKKSLIYEYVTGKKRVKEVR